MKMISGCICFFVAFVSCSICFAKEYKCVNVDKIEFTESDGSELKLVNVGKKQFIFEVTKKSQSDLELLQASLDKDIPGCLCLKTKPSGGTLELITAVGEITGVGGGGCVY